MELIFILKKNYDTLELQWSEGKHFGTILKLWYFDLTRKTHGRLAKTNKTLIYTGGKCNMPKKTEVFDRIHSFRTVIYYSIMENM